MKQLLAALIIMMTCTTANAAIDVVVVKPETVRVGQLVILSLKITNDASPEAITGAQVEWKTNPETNNFLVIDDGQRAVVCFEKPGSTHRFAVAVHVDGILKLEFFDITVEGAAPTPKPVDPVDPVDPVVPTPGDFDGLHAKVLASVASVSTNPVDVQALASAFRTIALATDSGQYNTVGEMIIATSTATKKALGGNLNDWAVFRATLSTELQRLNREGKLVTVQHHSSAWKLIAKALTEHANSL